MKTILVRYKVKVDLAAFKAFTAEIKDRCEEPPVPVELTAVGAYRLSGA